MTRSALIVVDVQKDFCEGGSLAVEGGNKVARLIREHIDTDPADYIVSTRDWHIDPGTHFARPPAEPDFKESWPVHCVAESEGAQYNDALCDVNWDAEFTKGEYTAAYSGFEGTIPRHSSTMGMNWYLIENRISTVYVVGIATDYCVKATAYDARRHGFKTIVLTDMCAGVDPYTSERALEELDLFGVDIR